MKVTASINSDPSKRLKSLETLGLRHPATVHWNNSATELYQMAVAHGEGLIAEGGPLVVTTGQHTGRSAQDKFIVRDAASQDAVWWSNNKAMEPGQFDAPGPSVRPVA